MKHLNKNENFRNRLFLYILTAVFVPVIILGIYSYNTYRSEVTKKLNTSALATAGQVKSRVDGVLLNIRKNYIESINCDEIDWLLNSPISYSEYSQLVGAIDVLDGSTYLSEYISGYSFVNFKTGWVLSNRGLYPFQELNNKEDVRVLYQYEKDTLVRDFWFNRQSRGSSKALPRETVDLNNLSFIMKLPTNTKLPCAVMVVNVNQQRIEELLSEDLGSNYITVLDKQGNLIYTTNDEIYSYCALHKEDLREDIVDSVKISNGKEYKIAVRTSDVLDWTYIVSYDMALELDGAVNILSFAGVMGLVSIIVLIIAIIWTNRIYKPVFKMENTIVSQRSQLKELFVTRLIKGEIRKEQLEYYTNKLNIEIKQYKTVISINIRSGETDGYDETKQDAIRIEALEKLPEEIKKMLLVPAICHARAIVLFLMDDNQEILEEKIDKIYEEMKHFVNDEYELNISMGVGPVFEDITMFRDAYHKSVEALKNCDRFSVDDYSNSSEIMYYSDITDKQSTYSYDLILEKDIKEAVDACEKEKAFEVVDLFLDGIVKNKLSSGESCFCMQRFMTAIIMVATNAGLLVDELFKEDSVNVFYSLNQIYDLEKIRNFYKFKVVEPIIDELNAFRSSHSSEIMDKIQDIIEETKGDITLSECAQRLNYHPSYIWKIMKSKKNTTFSEYIAEYKIQEAKGLLLNTDMTVAEVAVQLNYTNTQNFIRFFSKHVGTTPGKYRQNYKNVTE